MTTSRRVRLSARCAVAVVVASLLPSLGWQQIDQAAVGSAAARAAPQPEVVDLDGLRPAVRLRRTTPPEPAPSPNPVPPAPSPEGPKPSDLPGWQLVFTDDFNTDVPLGRFPAAVSAKWSAYPSPWKDSSKFGTYSPSDVVSVDNGVLTKHLHTAGGVHKVSALVPKVTTGSTGQTYGRYSVTWRADKLPGYKIAWLLWPDSGVWPRDGEIDFPEMNLTETSVGGYVHYQGATSGSDQAWARAPINTNSWHTTVIEWSPGLVVFLLDGVQIGRTTSRVPNTAMHWVLQTETTIGASPPADSVAGDVQIDSVSVWTYDPTAH